MASIGICFTPTKPRQFSSSSVPPSVSLTLRSRTLVSYRRLAPTMYRPIVIRANVQIPTGIKPGSRVETDTLRSDVRDRAMSAVDSFGGRVTIGDVAGKAGLKMNEAERALQAIAADTGGFLEVSDEGDVLYVLPKDFRSKLSARSFRMKIEPIINKSKAAFEYI